MLPSINRLNLRLNRDRINSAGKIYHRRNFSLLIARRNLETISAPSRFAVLLSKKTSKLAVDRNRLKRLVTESLRQNLSSLPNSIDTIVIPKKTALSLNITEITSELLSIFNEISI